MYLSGNNLPRIKLIRGKLFPDSFFFLRQVFTPYDCLLILVAFVVLCRVGCLEITCVFTSFTSNFDTAQKKNDINILKYVQLLCLVI